MEGAGAFYLPFFCLPSVLMLRDEAPNNELLFQKTGSNLLQGCL